MAAEVPQIHQAMDGPHHRREEAADALARGLVASLATPLERIGCDDDAHGDVAVEGAEGEQDAQAQERGPDVPRSSWTSSSSSSSSCCVPPLHVQWLRHERGILALTVRSPVVDPSDVIIPVM